MNKITIRVYDKYDGDQSYEYTIDLKKDYKNTKVNDFVSQVIHAMDNGHSFLEYGNFSSDYDSIYDLDEVFSECMEEHDTNSICKVNVQFWR